jgi:hypothetical protein
LLRYTETNIDGFPNDLIQHQIIIRVTEIISAGSICTEIMKKKIEKTGIPRES